MKKYIYILAISIGMVLAACGTKSGSTTNEVKDSTSVKADTTAVVSIDSTALKADTTVSVK